MPLEFCGRGADALLNSLPREFWHILLVEFGIVVYPTAMTEEFGGLGSAPTFTELYEGHISRLPRDVDGKQ